MHIAAGKQKTSFTAWRFHYRLMLALGAPTIPCCDKLFDIAALSFIHLKHK
jgi:hypothetical protein